MPWATPKLKDVRTLVRDNITAALSGAQVLGNSVLRVMADANAGLAHLCLRYLDWLARQLIPDTAETEWLDRHGDIWLVNADNTIGRKAPAMAHGSVTFTGVPETVVPIGTRLVSGLALEYETTEQVTIGESATECAVLAIEGGEAGNLDAGETLSLSLPVLGVDSTVTVVELEGGTEQENDDDLRARVLLRIREPPMGGDRSDYVLWALSFPGVTRAWCYPLEMGVGTVTVRFMMDDLRADNDGFPNEDDVAALAAYLDTVRPVAVKDFFVEAPIPYPLDMIITGLVIDSETVRADIALALEEMLVERVAPGMTVYRSWVDEAISGVVREQHHELVFTTTPMAAPGYLAVVGDISYDVA